MSVHVGTLSDRVDGQFRRYSNSYYFLNYYITIYFIYISVGLALQDINGMMRHVLDCMGALKFRLEEGFTDGKITYLIIFIIHPSILEKLSAM